MSKRPSISSPVPPIPCPWVYVGRLDASKVAFQAVICTRGHAPYEVMLQGTAFRSVGEYTGNAAATGICERCGQVYCADYSSPFNEGGEAW